MRLAKIEEQELDVKKEEKGVQEEWIQELKQQLGMWKSLLPMNVQVEDLVADNPVTRFLQREIKKATTLLKTVNSDISTLLD